MVLSSQKVIVAFKYVNGFTILDITASSIRACQQDDVCRLFLFVLSLFQEWLQGLFMLGESRQKLLTWGANTL